MKQHVDVLIAGAGLSGIAAAYYLKDKCPDKTFAIVEGRDAIGGTWDLFRFPGIRSDSDMYTLGYSFRPWPEEDSIGEGESIRTYLEDTAKEIGILDKIRFRTRIERASFSSTDGRWTVYTRNTASDEEQVLTCNFFWSCMGYYRYDEGYTPKFEGTERFGGRIVHPQHWDENIDYEGKRILIIGSGATAMTMLPVVAKKAEKVTMVQRSPTYVIAWPRRDRLAGFLRRVLGAKRAHPIIRWKNIRLMALFYAFMRRFPRISSWLLIRQAHNRLGEGYDVERHFTPRYNPWDQRLCLVPDGDIFDAISAGRAEVVTDQIDTFTEHGLLLRSGTELEADLIVTATGFSLQWLGGVEMDVDGVPFEPAKAMIYKGSMLGGLPNCAFVFGYINSSWTLRAELVCDYVCRLLRFMDDKGYGQCCPEPDPSVEALPPLDLSAGYVTRAVDTLPSQGSRDPWRFNQSYALDRALLQDQPIDDGTLRFTPSKPVVEDTLVPSAAAESQAF
jgi:monooxygenase